MMPGALLLIPLYLFMNDLQLIDTHLSLVLAYTSFTLPYCTYILKGYFESIPPDLDEAAMVDGCNRVGALFRVIMPLAAPGIVVTLTSAFIMAWNEFMFALTFLNTYPKWTLPLALGTFRGQYLVDWGFLFAGSTLVTLPVLILFLVLQKWLASGFVSGAVKG
jgi:ABC-type glycerol-3-phosphate transport system permease component